MPDMPKYSVAVTVIGVIQLAGKVTSLGYGYIGGVDRAPKYLREFVDELAALSKVLIAIQDHTDKDPTSEVIHSLNEVRGPFQGCARELEILQTKLEPKNGEGLQSVMDDKLQWPLDEEQTKEYIGRVKRLKDIFELSLKPDYDKNEEVKSELARLVKDYTEDESLEVHMLPLDHPVVVNWYKREEALRMEEKRENVLNWLYPEDPEARHNEISNRRQRETGKWLTDRPEFTEWLLGYDPDSLFIWGYGIHGVGKTYLSSVVVDYFPSGPLAETVNYGLAYIYFDYREKNRQEPEHIIASLIKQLGSQTLGLPIEIQELHDRLTPTRKRPTYEELFTALLSTFESFDRVYFVMDGLDEIADPEKRKKFLDLCHRISKYEVRFWFASRNDESTADIKAFMDKLRAARIELLVDDGDIKKYISEKIEDTPRAKRLVQQGKSKEKIVNALAICAGNMILLVRFHIEYICQQTTAKQILHALEKLKIVIDREGPLDPTFDRAMENMRRQPKNCSGLAMEVIIWLSKTRRTLTIDEIQVAVSIEARRERLDELDLPDRTTLFDVCGSLVSIHEQSGTIRLSHQSVNDYLIESHVVPEHSDEKITVALMTYLGFESLSTRIDNNDLPARLKAQPFLSYVVTQIQYHLKLCPETVTLDVVQRFLGMPINIYSYLQAASFCNAKMRGDILIPEFPSEPLEYPDFATKPAIHVAIILGHFLAIQDLVEKGADLLERDSWGQTVIHEAVMAGDENVFRYLLEKDVDVLVADHKLQTALQRACAVGNETMVRLLLDKGAEVKTVDTFGRNCLHDAALGGYEGIVKMLLERDIDFTVVDERGHNPLMEAASGGHKGIVNLLLDKGADSSLIDIDGRSIIHLAAHDGYHNVVKCLLETGAHDLSLLDNSGQTALHIATARGHKSTVEILANHGADVHGKTRDGDSVLHRAAIYGQRTIAMYLIGEGHVDIKVRDANGRTALEVAEIARREQLAMVLKGKGAEEEIKEAINRERLVQVLNGNLNPENPGNPKNPGPPGPPGNVDVEMREA